ncbi:MAG: MATE family multidrug resistance protein [Lentimonas sp.]|jgi:MATE family multidrug resistance protein
MLDFRYRSILAVAVPLMGSSFIQSIVLWTDASFLSRYNTLSFDAAGNGGLIYVTLLMILLGLGDGSQILHARRIGQEKWEALGRIFGTTISSNFIIALILIFLIQLLVGPGLAYFSFDKELAAAETDYIEIRSIALFFVAITFSINAFFFAVGTTWKVLICSIITAGSNIFLDYGMIFGHFGFEEMGLKGAAYASTIADGIGMIASFTFLYFSLERKKYSLLKHFKLDFTSMKELFKLGTPILLQGFIALSTWTIFFTWIEHKGSFELTVSQNIRAIYLLAFVPIFGFSATTKTYISQCIGKNKPEDLKKIQKRILILTMLFLTVFFHGAILYPEVLIRAVNPEEVYVQKSAEIMRMVGGSIFLFGFVSVFYQTINGSGNTRASFYIEVIAVVIYLVSAYFFIKVWNFDIYHIWTVEYIYFGSLGTFSLLYLKFFDWKNKQL